MHSWCREREVEDYMNSIGHRYHQFVSQNILYSRANGTLSFRIECENISYPIPNTQVAPVTLVMPNFTEKVNNKKCWYSKPFFAFNEGYQIRLSVDAAGYGDGEGTHVSVFLQLMRGPHDDKLERSGHWPLRGTFTIELLNQLNDSDHYGHKIVLYDYLRSRCSEREVEDYMNSIGHGYRQFVSHNIIFYKKG